MAWFLYSSVYLETTKYRGSDLLMTHVKTDTSSSYATDRKTLGRKTLGRKTLDRKTLDRKTLDRKTLDRRHSNTTA
jgi:hypothetical protein